MINLLSRFSIATKINISLYGSMFAFLIVIFLLHLQFESRLSNSDKVRQNAEMLLMAVHSIQKNTAFIFEETVGILFNLKAKDGNFKQEFDALYAGIKILENTTKDEQSEEIKSDIARLNNLVDELHATISKINIESVHRLYHITQTINQTTNILNSNMEENFHYKNLLAGSEEILDKYMAIAFVIVFFAFLATVNQLIISTIIDNLSKLKERIISLLDFIDKKSTNINFIEIHGEDEVAKMIKNINEHVENVKKVILDERMATQQLKAMQESLLDKIEIATKESIELYREIEDTQKEVVFTLGMIAEERCNETSTHVKRVAEYSLILSRLAGLSEKEAHEVKYASPMHDIGKIGIPDAILKKSGKLTEEEFETMRSHATIGYEILKHSDKSILRSAAIIAHEHHEKYNGRGYPRGLHGEDIHIYARIVAIADVFDALGSDRIYKKAWPLEEIINFFEKEKGEHFDPVLTSLFLSNIELFVAAREKINAGFEYIDRKIIEEEIKEKMRGEACA